MLNDLLKNHRFHPVVPKERQFGRALIVDLSPSSEIWQHVTEQHSFSDEMAQRAVAIEAQVVIGRYNEQRLIYQDTDNFAGQEHRTVHMGIDLGLPALTPIYAPYTAQVHSVANHNNDGDYGPTVILCHQLEGQNFYTLYGHLHWESVKALSIGQTIKTGEAFASIGTPEENGGWAPHLHLQVIKDMGKHHSDYPGVVDPKQLDFYLDNCPDPNLILGREDL
ncbi:peptidoglycan DD-metalloendopeptidase family protein [Photobacterium damselae subsp. damselae]